MQYTVRNRRRLRTTGEHAVSRTMTNRGTGVPERMPVEVEATPDAVPQEEPTSRVRAQGTGSHVAPPSKLSVTEVVPASVFRKNFDR